MHMKKIKPTLELDQQIISFYEAGEGTYQIADKLSCSQTFIMNRLKKNNIPRRDAHSYTRKYITNENFFDTIDTEAKAYFLGLMYADGNNYVRGTHSYEMSIALEEGDKYILEKFRDVISRNTQLKFMDYKKR